MMYRYIDTLTHSQYTLETFLVEMDSLTVNVKTRWSFLNENRLIMVRFLTETHSKPFDVLPFPVGESGLICSFKILDGSFSGVLRCGKKPHLATLDVLVSDKSIP